MPIPDLLPCPFCGVPAAMRIKAATPLNQKSTIIVECSNTIDCPVWPMTNPASTPGEAARKWNTRSTSPDVQQAPNTRGKLTSAAV